MDRVRKMTQAECESVMDCIPVCAQALTPILAQKQEQIMSIERKTFQYGATERHQLDVYYPPETQSLEHLPVPVLFWSYGGGFISGDRSIAPTNGLLYANIGAYFASRGFLTIIPDYRLAPGVQWPGQSEDVRDAMVWAIDPANLNKLTKGNVHPNLEAGIFAMGHSAGAIAVATLFLHPELLQSTTILPRVRALVLHGITPHFTPGMDQMAAPYYGDPSTFAQKAVSGLLESATPEALSELPPICICYAEKEPSWIRKPIDEFEQALKKRLASVDGGRHKWTEPKMYECKGHNHVSVNWAIGTGEGEEWAEEAVLWMRTKYAERPHA